MVVRGNTLEETRRSGVQFPAWAIEEGMRPDGQLAVDDLAFRAPGGSRRFPVTFRGVLPQTDVAFTAGQLTLPAVNGGAARDTALTVLSAEVPEAAGLPAGLHAWRDPYAELLFTGADDLAYDDIPSTFALTELRDALAHPALTGPTSDVLAAPDVPTVFWSAGHVVVQWDREVGDPVGLDALVMALDAAVIAVQAGHARRVMHLNARAPLPEAGWRRSRPRPLVFGPRRGHGGRHAVAAYARRHGLVHEDPIAFRRRFWPLGVRVAPTAVVRGALPGTEIDGRLVWGHPQLRSGVGEGWVGAAIVPVGGAARERVSVAVTQAADAALVAGCLVVTAAGEAPTHVGADALAALASRAAALSG